MSAVSYVDFLQKIDNYRFGAKTHGEATPSLRSNGPVVLSNSK